MSAETMDYAPRELGHADDEHGAAAPKTAAPRKDWTVRLVYAGKLGVTWRLDVHAKGLAPQPVCVKETRYNTFACMSCLSVECEHSRFVRHNRPEIQETA